MDEFRVLTVRNLNFTDDHGNLVAGQQLWLCGQTMETGWKAGWEVLKVWIPDGHPLEDTVAELQHDDMVMIEFNRRGKPRSIVRSAAA